jgi:hypothetical protein
MLLGNYAQVNRNTTSDWGRAFSNPHAIMKATCLHRFYTTDANVVGETNKSAWNNGYNTHGAWFPAPKAGGLAAYRTADFGLTGAANGALGMNIDGDGTITFTVPNADMQLVVSADGTATITFSQTGALAGALAADGAASFAIATNTPILGAIISAIASGTITFSADGTVEAIGNLAGDITPFTTLSPENLAAAVWNEVLASHTTDGTTGKRLQQILTTNGFIALK